ncbi:MAG: HlyD family efflux transporter periplasmic adaptor subunit [Mogibacterium sp.]|nr:HlyD family efflux transporter periplasmic adaptor subunit [Mogibacterium sp.]
MRKIIIDIKDMSDSKEVYGERPNPFISIFIYGVVLLLVVAGIYSCVGEIEIVATAQGVIRPNQDVSTVTTLVDGKVENVHFRDGQNVKVDDTLISIDASNEQIKLTSMLEQLNKCTEDKDLKDKFLEGIRRGKNPFSSNPSSREYPYYVQFQDYQSSTRENSKNDSYSKSQAQSKIKSLKKGIRNTKKGIKKLSAYLESVRQQTDMVSNYAEYENKYKLYISDLDRIDNEYTSEKNAIKSSDGESERIKEQLGELEKTCNTLKEQRKLQELTETETAIKTKKDELQSLQGELDLYTAESNYYSKKDDVSDVKQMTSILAEKKALEEQIDELDTNIKLMKNQMKDAVIKAEQEGIVSTSARIVAGDILTAGTEIATIIPYDESEYSVYIYVSNSDIANIEVGDRIKYNLSALPSNQYGVVEGRVKKISADTIVKNEEYAGFFLVEGSIAKQKLEDKDGNTGDVSIGMQLEAKIVTEEKTIARYLLEKIKLK